MRSLGAQAPSRSSDRARRATSSDRARPLLRACVAARRGLERVPLFALPGPRETAALRLVRIRADADVARLHRQAARRASSTRIRVPGGSRSATRTSSDAARWSSYAERRPRASGAGGDGPEDPCARARGWTRWSCSRSRGAGDGLPANVEVRDVRRAIACAARLRGSSARSRSALRRPDAVVAHMVPDLRRARGAARASARRTPLLLWYTHWKASATLRARRAARDGVVSVDRRSFPLESPKVHGRSGTVSTSTSSPAPSGPSAPSSARWCSGATRRPRASRRSSGPSSRSKVSTSRLHGVALNELERRHRERARSVSASPLGDAVPRARGSGALRRALISSSTTCEAGAPDKVVYEAAAACLPVLASNPVFDELVRRLSSCSSSATRPRASPTVCAGSPRLDESERAEIGRTLRERVALRHSVETWADGVLAAAR